MQRRSSARLSALEAKPDGGKPTTASTGSRSSIQKSSVPSAASTPATRVSRGRPSKASTLGADSRSSIATTPGEATSPGEYSTPATSLEGTPAPFVTADGLVKREGGMPRSSIEVQIPAASMASSYKASRNGRYSLQSSLKKSIPDSEDEGFEEDELAASMKTTRRGRYALASRKKTEENDGWSNIDADEIVARRLQEEEYRQAAASPSPADTFTSSDAPVVSRKRGRPVAAAAAEPRPKRARPESESLDDLSDLTDINEVGDTLSDYDDDSEDVPLAKSAKKTAKPRTTKKTTTRTAASRAAPAIAADPMALDATDPDELDDDYESPLSSAPDDSDDSDSDANGADATAENRVSRGVRNAARNRRAFRGEGSKRSRAERDRLEKHHPELMTMWEDLKNMPVINAGRAQQPVNISRQLKPFQLEGLAWMKEMEKMEWKGGLLGDEMGLGKTIQAVSLIMSDWPAKQPTLVLVPPVALMQWSSEIASYTDGTLKTFMFHGTNTKTKGLTLKQLKQYNVIMMSYNSLESMFRKQEKGFKRKDGLYKEKSLIHQINFHRVILDEAHCIKTRTTMTAKACFALKTDYRWCLSGTPLQNRIGEFFSLIRFLNVRPFASYLCKQCPCSQLEWSLDADSRCTHCGHAGMQHVSVFNQELLNPIQKYGSMGPGADAFKKLRLMTERIMLRRLKKDHTNSMDLPVKEVNVDRQFFGEVENDFANSIMTNSKRKFETYVAQGVLLNNYANIFGLIMQMRQVADHPDLLLKKSAEGGQNILVCCICDEPAEDAIRSRCKHDFCRACAKGYLLSSDEPDCPQCHIPLSIDLEQPEMEQDGALVKKSSIINRIKMENWTSSSKIEMLLRDLHKLRSDHASHKSIIFSQFTSMLQLIEWRLRRAGISTVMLDGSMTPAQRQASIDHFMNTPEVECFLVSLKAGGVALNLTEASRVFIVDPWWNPAAEWQSADRCHRIGQTRPCTITRLCIEDSVESRMVLIQEKKTNMIHSTVNADDKAMESLSPQDMQFLFRGN